MLKNFSVKNYKNFQNTITVDMSKVGGYRFNSDCIANGIITKLLIYGRNATGKTNLGMAITDIQNILFDNRGLSNDIFLNADSEDDVAEFSYEFDFEGEKIEYSYSMGENRKLHTEKMLLNDSIIYDINFKTGKFELQLSKIHAQTLVTDMYQNLIAEGLKEGLENKQLPFLRWLINNAAFSSNSPLIKLHSYVYSMQMISIRLNTQIRSSNIYSRFYEILAQNENLKQFEEFLNEMGIDCKLLLQSLPDGKKELYFNHKVPLPFVPNASSGTIALMNLYILIIMPAINASFFYIDEFDAFYHYEMADKVIQYMKKHYPKCQFIMTTHNTNLMSNRLMRPDCLQILSSFGTLTALSDATERELREGHNLQKMYISGEFESYE